MNPPNVSLLLVMVCFWVTFWLIRRFLILPVGRVLEDRNGRIDGAEAQWATKHEEFLSASLRVESALDAAAREAGRIRGDRRQQAQAQRQQALEAARAAADERLRGALTTLDHEATAARAELERRAAELSRLFATRLLGREVTS